MDETFILFKNNLFGLPVLKLKSETEIKVFKFFILTQVNKLKIDVELITLGKVNRHTKLIDKFFH